MFPQTNELKKRAVQTSQRSWRKLEMLLLYLMLELHMQKPRAHILHSLMKVQPSNTQLEQTVALL